MQIAFYGANSTPLHKLLPGLALAILMAGYAANAQAEDPWADTVVAYQATDPNSGFDTPEKTLGEPVGGGTFAASSSSICSLGIAGSYIILQFNTPVTDDPANPMGLDCIVYGNAYWTGGDPQRRWAEPGLLEISEDVNHDGIANDPWYVIPGSRAVLQSEAATGIPNPAPPLVSAGGVVNPNSTDADTSNDLEEYDWGYADSAPTQKKYLDNYVRPDDPFTVGLTARSGGGDAFDIAWAVDAAGQPANLSQFHFLRIWTLVQGTAVGDITTEIDAAADVAPEIDADNDGILDEYETRVAGADPARSESTVLALEIPAEEGGSAAGTLLGEAADANGNRIRLYSSGPRYGTRNNNCIVDILAPADPGGSIPGLTKSGAVREFQSSEADFDAAQIQDAEYTIVYTAADIAGLDEVGLQPYRYEAGGYTQTGISSVTRDTAANTLTFRTQYPGIFVLAAAAGAGDIDTGVSNILLSATPPEGIIAEPINSAAITSDPILLPDDSPAPDGMLFTVATTLGHVISPDLDVLTPGIQIAASSQTIAFPLSAGTQAGKAHITAISLDGTVSGALDYDFLPGPPAGPVAILLYTPEATAPGPLTFITDTIADRYGNAIPDGALLTVTAAGGVFTSSDASPATPGHQVRVVNGLAGCSVRIDTPEDAVQVELTLSIYADATLYDLLGEETFSLEVGEPIKVPAAASGALLALAAALVLLGARKGSRV